MTLNKLQDNLKLPVYSLAGIFLAQLYLFQKWNVGLEIWSNRKIFDAHCVNIIKAHSKRRLDGFAIP